MDNQRNYLGNSIPAISVTGVQLDVTLRKKSNTKTSSNPTEFALLRTELGLAGRHCLDENLQIGRLELASNLTIPPTVIVGTDGQNWFSNITVALHLCVLNHSFES